MPKILAPTEPLADTLFDALLRSAAAMTAREADRRAAGTTCPEGAEGRDALAGKWADELAEVGLPRPAPLAYPSDGSTVCPLVLPLGLSRHWIEFDWWVGELAGTNGAKVFRNWIAALRRLHSVGAATGEPVVFALVMPIADRGFRSWKRGPVYDDILAGCKALKPGMGRDVIADASHTLSRLMQTSELELTAGQAVALLTNLIARTRDTHPHFRKLKLGELVRPGVWDIDACRAWMWWDPFASA